MKYLKLFGLIICIISLSGSVFADNEYLQKVDSADFYIKIEKWTDAERNLKDALRIEPANILNSMLLANLGYVQHSQGKIDEAIESYSVGLAMTPNSFVLKKQRASAYLEIGKTDEAYSDLTDAIGLECCDTWVRNTHGFIALQKGELEVARDDFQTIYDSDPTTSNGLLGLTMWADYSGNKQLALEYITKLLEKEKNPENYFTRALLYIKVKNYPAADDDVREGLAIDMRYGDLYVLRAYLHKLRYRNEEAEIDKKIAIEYNADAQLIQDLLQ